MSGFLQLLLDPANGPLRLISMAAGLWFGLRSSANRGRSLAGVCTASRIGPRLGMVGNVILENFILEMTTGWIEGTV